MSPEVKQLFNNLQELYRTLREKTYAKYNRMNPTYEELFDFKEKGKFWTGKNNVTIYNSATVSGKVKIGENTWIGPFCSLDGSGGLTIGRYCSISLGCQILTHDTVSWSLSGGKVSHQRKPSYIGDNCFIGTYSIVTKGVKIGNHCLIGANSLVNKDIPDNSIAFGTPAKVVGKVIITKNGQVKLCYEK